MPYQAETLVHNPSFHLSTSYGPHAPTSSDLYQDLYPNPNVPFSNSISRQSSLTPSGYSFHNPFVYNGANPGNRDSGPGHPSFQASFAPTPSSSHNDAAHRSTSTNTNQQESTSSASMQHGPYAPVQLASEYSSGQDFMAALWAEQSIQPQIQKELLSGQADGNIATGPRFSQLLETKLNLEQPTIPIAQSTNAYSYSSAPPQQGAMPGGFDMVATPSSSVPTSQPMSALPTGQSHSSMSSYPVDPLAIDAALQDYSQVGIRPNAAHPIPPYQYFADNTAYAGPSGSQHADQTLTQYPSLSTDNDNAQFFPSAPSQNVPMQRGSDGMHQRLFALQPRPYAVPQQYSSQPPTSAQSSSNDTGYPVMAAMPQVNFAVPQPHLHGSLPYQNSAGASSQNANFGAFGAGSVQNPPARRSPTQSSSIALSILSGGAPMSSSLHTPTGDGPDHDHGSAMSTQTRLSALSPHRASALGAQPSSHMHPLISPQAYSTNLPDTFVPPPPPVSLNHLIPPHPLSSQQDIPAAVPLSMDASHRATKKRKLGSPTSDSHRGPTTLSPPISLGGVTTISNDTCAWESNPPQAEEKKPTIACHLCRSKKLKCDGARPRCGTCTKKGEESCEYDAVLRRRGPGKNNKRDAKAKFRHVSRQDDPNAAGKPTILIGGWDGETAKSWDGDGLAMGRSGRFETSTSRGE